MTHLLAGKTAWVTGAGSGIGEAAALALSGAGATVIASGRRRELLDGLVDRIKSSGGRATAMDGDLGDAAVPDRIVRSILGQTGRLDILINNAGTNIRARRWDELVPEGIDIVLRTNLSAAFYCAAAALKPMREQKDGVLIHTGSWAGRFWSTVPGSAYTAAKIAVTAMSHSINLEESRNGIRSTVVMPAEVATPILDSRPVPPPAEVRASMLQPGDMAELYLFLATRPASVCINEVVISPTQSRMVS